MPRTNRSTTTAISKSLDVLTIGSATRDIFVRSSAFERFTNPSAPDGFNVCFPMGAKLPAEEIVTATGGGATNTAFTFSRMGFRTACLCRIGSDDAADVQLAELEHEGISTEFIQQDSSLQTGHSIIFLAGTGERAIFTSRGASKNLSIPKPLPFASTIYLTSLGGNHRSLETVFDAVRAQGAFLAWNPGRGELEDGRAALAPYLAQTDLLILNLEEASLLAETSPRFTDRILKILAPLPRQGLILTLGERGAIASIQGQTLIAGRLPKTRVNTTGAGDAFGSGFVASYLKQPDIRRALQVASLNALGVVTHMGAKAGILRKEPSTVELHHIPVHEH